MARKVKCPNGHWYDAEQYQECPHCEDQNLQAESAGDNEEKEVIVLTSKKKRHWWFMGKKRQREMDEMTYTAPIAEKNIDDIDRQNVFPEKQSETEEAQDEKEKLFYAAAQSNKALEEEKDIQEEAAENLSMSENETPDLGKTVAYYDFGEAEPVVGWLICTRGIYFGQEFRLKTGRNFIGRAITMDVCIMKDKSVSREKHAIITYEPRSRTFSVQQGESSKLIYQNGEAVYERKVLAAFDQLEIGEGTYLFLPLCGTDFTWDDYVKKE